MFFLFSQMFGCFFLRLYLQATKPEKDFKAANFYFHVVEIYFLDVEIYFLDVKIYFLDVKIVFPT